MSDNKQYYYIKLKEDFFEDDKIKVIEKMPDGYKYVNILLKLYLRSLRGNGRLMFSSTIPYNSAMIASLVNQDESTVVCAIKLFQESELIEILDNGAIYMLDIQNYIGKSSTEADRIRNYRRTINEEKAMALECSKDVGADDETEHSVQMYDKSTPEIRDKSIEIKDKSIDIKKENISSKEDISKKKPKEGKHKYGEFKNVLLKDSELEKLNEEYGEDIANHCISYLDTYIEEKGYKSKSHYLAIRRWVLDVIQQKQKRNQPNNKGQVKNDALQDFLNS